MDMNNFKGAGYIVDQYLQTTIEDRTGRMDDMRFWPTEGSLVTTFGNVGTCLRKTYYAIIGVSVSNPMDIIGKRTVEFGNIIEAQERDRLRACDLMVSDDDEDVRFRHEIDNIIVSGAVDSIIKPHKDSKEFVVWECKSGYGYFFEKEVFGSADNPGMPKVDHLMQVMLYIDFFKDHPKFPTRCANIQYISKGGAVECMNLNGEVRKSKIKDFIITMDGDNPVVNGCVLRLYTLSGIYDRFKYLLEHVNKKVLPSCDYINQYTAEDIQYLYDSREISKQRYNKMVVGGEAKYGARDFHCSYCPYLDRCLKEKKGPSPDLKPILQKKLSKGGV